MKRIILTGGGTAGHVTPNIALLPRLKELQYDIHYIGSYNGIEKDLIEPFHIPYHGISSGKLRRYFSMKNFTDPFRVLKGFHEANQLIKALKPDVIFSKGGFVSVPVVMAGKRNHVPTIIHESDITPGLANKLSMPSATKICCNFPETLKNLPADKAILTGSPIRQELLTGDREMAKKFCHFTSDKPVILVIGGSLGAAAVNQAVRNILPELLESFQIIHLCGKGKLDESLINIEGSVCAVKLRCQSVVVMHTPVKTSWVRPDIVRNICKASSLSWGLPSTLPSSHTIVSAVIINSPGCIMAT